MFFDPRFRFSFWVRFVASAFSFPYNINATDDARFGLWGDGAIALHGFVAATSSPLGGNEIRRV
jgi:hypothetical protein